jgi:Skp family chaperone for outer membrane proteins
MAKTGSQTPGGTPERRRRAGDRLVWGVAAVLAALVVVGAAQTFRPPRTAVVSISEVFDGYEKKVQRQEQLAQLRDQLKQKIVDLEAQYEQLVEEIKLTRGEAQAKKKLERYQLELKVETVKERDLAGLQTQYIEYLKEIRKEINDEIRQYAVAQDLDLVLERTVIAEGTPSTPGFQWPIVHYSKPEIDITQEIVGRLNRRLQQP